MLEIGPSLTKKPKQTVTLLLPEAPFLELAAAPNLQIMLLKGPHLTSSKDSLKQATSSGLSVFHWLHPLPPLAERDSYQACLLSFYPRILVDLLCKPTNLLREIEIKCLSQK